MKPRQGIFPQLPSSPLRALQGELQDRAALEPGRSKARGLGHWPDVSVSLSHWPGETASRVVDGGSDRDGPGLGSGAQTTFPAHERSQEQGQEPGFLTSVSSLCVRGPSEQKTHWGDLRTLCWE